MKKFAFSKIDVGSIVIAEDVDGKQFKMTITGKRDKGLMPIIASPLEDVCLNRGDAEESLHKTFHAGSSYTFTREGSYAIDGGEDDIHIIGIKNPWKKFIEITVPLSAGMKVKIQVNGQPVKGVVTPGRHETSVRVKFEKGFQHPLYPTVDVSDEYWFGALTGTFNNDIYGNPHRIRKVKLQ